MNQFLHLHVEMELDEAFARRRKHFQYDAVRQWHFSEIKAEAVDTLIAAGNSHHLHDFRLQHGNVESVEDLDAKPQLQHKLVCISHALRLAVDQQRLRWGLVSPHPLKAQRDGDGKVHEARIALDVVAVGAQQRHRVAAINLSPSLEPDAFGCDQKREGMVTGSEQECLLAQRDYRVVDIFPFWAWVFRK